MTTEYTNIVEGAANRFLIDLYWFILNRLVMIIKIKRMPLKSNGY